ncbi:unnamed protein product [Durusdinium trenchii]|uniref:Uncharacterized protein n=1 Tax=Durusdinium trenchii TaxID=1381693 RepID=A0ABP0I9H1_9DINO
MWCRWLCALLVAVLACLLGLLSFLVDLGTSPPRHHEVLVQTSEQYKVIPRATEAEGLPVLVLMTEAINAAMVTHALLVADAAKPFFEVHLASFGGAYAKLLEQSEFQYHALSPQWTEEQSKAIYAADQFESFSNPYTEVLHEQIASSLHLYSTIRPSAVAAFFVLSASISARIARLPLFVDMSMTREYATEPKAIAASIADDGVVTKMGLRMTMSHVASWLMKRMTFIAGPFEAAAREWNITGIHLIWDLMEGDYTVISDIPSWVGVDEKKLPPQVTYVGPLYGKLKMEIPPEVMELREKATQEGQPLIWFAMGSSGQPPLVLSILRELLRQQPRPDSPSWPLELVGGGIWR